MSNVVISQPMYFPWVGLFEQVALADVFVHYDNVQLPQGRSFITRVQIKTETGTQWLSAPVKRQAGQLIQSVELDGLDWRRKHVAALRHAYARTPYVDGMIELVESVYAKSHTSLCELNIAAIETLSAYLGLSARFVRASEHPIKTHSTQKLIDYCTRYHATRYVTGHGALKYMDHDAFVSNGITVDVMDYQCIEYDQPHGVFTPYVSILDAIACLGPEAHAVIQPATRDWKELVDDHA
ncbi:MAG: WbqC family protein [Planctomycetota bacterium]